MLSGLDPQPPAPAARLLMTPTETSQTATQAAAEQLVTAYVPEITPDADAQRALEMLIARSDVNAANAVVDAAPLPAPRPAPELRIASLGKMVGLQGLPAFVDGGSALVSATPPPVAAAPAAVVPLPGAEGVVELVAPDLAHVAQIFVTPVPVSADRFAVLGEAQALTLRPTPELGAYVAGLAFSKGAPGLDPTRFVPQPPPADGVELGCPTAGRTQLQTGTARSKCR